LLGRRAWKEGERGEERRKDRGEKGVLLSALVGSYRILIAIALFGVECALGLGRGGWGFSPGPGVELRLVEKNTTEP